MLLNVVRDSSIEPGLLLILLLPIPDWCFLPPTILPVLAPLLSPYALYVLIRCRYFSLLSSRSWLSYFYPGSADWIYNYKMGVVMALYLLTLLFGTSSPALLLRWRYWSRRGVLWWRLVGVWRVFRVFVLKVDLLSRPRWGFLVLLSFVWDCFSRRWIPACNLSCWGLSSINLFVGLLYDLVSCSLFLLYVLLPLIILGLIVLFVLAILI